MRDPNPVNTTTMTDKNTESKPDPRKAHETIEVELPRWVLTETIAFAEVVEGNKDNPVSLRRSATAVREVLEGRLEKHDNKDDERQQFLDDLCRSLGECTCGLNEACSECSPTKRGFRCGRPDDFTIEVEWSDGSSKPLLGPDQPRDGRLAAIEQRLRDVEEIAQQARADTKDEDTTETLVARVEHLESRFDKLARDF